MSVWPSYPNHHSSPVLRVSSHHSSLLIPLSEILLFLFCHEFPTGKDFSRIRSRPLTLVLASQSGQCTALQLPASLFMRAEVVLYVVAEHLSLSTHVLSPLLFINRMTVAALSPAPIFTSFCLPAPQQQSLREKISFPLLLTLHTDPFTLLGIPSLSCIKINTQFHFHCEIKMALLIKLLASTKLTREVVNRNRRGINFCHSRSRSVWVPPEEYATLNSDIDGLRQLNEEFMQIPLFTFHKRGGKSSARCCSLFF